MIAAQSLRKDYGGVRALDGISIAVSEGALFGVVGPNGAGKSTLFDILAGSTRPLAGSVTLEGRRIDGLPPHEVAARGVARTRQATRLFARMTALENVVAGTHPWSADSFLGHVFLHPVARRARATARAAAKEMLSLLGLSDREDDDVRRLSEGERRRVALARAMVSRPKVLLLDELAAGLTFDEATTIFRSMAAFARERGVAVLLAERDLAACAEYCTRVLVLQGGQKVAEGAPEILRTDPDVRDAYLGVEWRQ